MILRVLAGVLLVAVLGVPMVDTWRVLLLAAGLLALVCGDVDRRRWKRIAAAAGVAAAMLTARAVLPRADIAEGHNIFLVYDAPDVLEELPLQVYASWKAQFEAIYPASLPPRGDSFHQTQTAPVMPLYAWSADSVWRPAKYSRQVDEISFTSLADFRGGFANGTIGDAAGTVAPHNFFGGRMYRETAPFWVMYELTPASVGSRLRWKGPVFWERADGGFDEIVHAEPAARAIAPEDAGRRVYAAFFSVPGAPSFDVPPDQHYFELELSPRLRWSRWLEIVLSVAAWFAVFALTVRVQWRRYLPVLVLFAAAYAVMAGYVAVGLGKFLGREYMPLGGGDDGLAFEFYGRLVAMHLSRGEVIEALKGGEALYWFQPGLRYFRAVEKVFFGDTYQLYALVVAGLPLMIWALVRHFTTARWAWIAAGLFIGALAGGFSFLQYARFAKLGYGEPVGVLCFLLGLVILLRAEPRFGGRGQLPASAVWLAGLAFAVAVFVRPNYVLAVGLISGAYAWASLPRRAFGSMAALAAGLSFMAVMPLHNWYYGGEFILLSKSGATSAAMLFGVGDYVRALRDLLGGDTASTAVLLKHLQSWVFDPGATLHASLVTVTKLLHPLKLIALVCTVGVLVQAARRRATIAPGLWLVAASALLSLVPLLFSRYTTFRYTMLAWDLCLLVTFVTLVRQPRVHRLLERRSPAAPVAYAEPRLTSAS